MCASIQLSVVQVYRKPFQSCNISILVTQKHNWHELHVLYSVFPSNLLSFLSVSGKVNKLLRLVWLPSLEVYALVSSTVVIASSLLRFNFVRWHNESIKLIEKLQVHF